jgi:hypothetical protein
MVLFCYFANRCDCFLGGTFPKESLEIVHLLGISPVYYPPLSKKLLDKEDIKVRDSRYLSCAGDQQCKGSTLSRILFASQICIRGF